MSYGEIQKKALLELSSVEEGTSRRVQFKDKTFLKDEPGRRIVWQSDGSAFHSAGGVIFEEGPGGPRHAGYRFTRIPDWDGRENLAGDNRAQPEARKFLKTSGISKARAETRENQ
jgi:hypothetical protein